MPETFSPDFIEGLVDRLLAQHSVEPARARDRLNTARTAELSYGRDRLAVDELVKSSHDQRGFRFVYDAAVGPVRADVRPDYERTTVLWDVQRGREVRVSTLTNNHGNADAVIAHFMRAAA
jgi:hypothetical protein